MILTRVHLRNFRCVKDSGRFKVDRDTTCLVGKNESGKTALLQALNKLNPVIKEQGDFEDFDYPVMQWTEYKARKDDDPAPALSTWWQLEPEDAEVLRPTFGDSIAYDAEVEVSKGYSNTRTLNVRVDEEMLVAHLLSRFELLEEPRGEPVVQQGEDSVHHVRRLEVKCTQHLCDARLGHALERVRNGGLPLRGGLRTELPNSRLQPHRGAEGRPWQGWRRSWTQGVRP